MKKKPTTTACALCVCVFVRSMNIYKVTAAAAAAGTAHGHQRTRMRHAARRHREWPGPHRMEPSHARPGPSRAERCNRKQSKLICSLVCFGQMYLKSVNVSAGCLTHSAQILCACVCVCVWLATSSMRTWGESKCAFKLPHSGADNSL